MSEKDEKRIIPAALAERLISAHDGDVALLCVYAALHPEASDEAAAGALCRTSAEIAAAREKLERIRLSAGEPPRALPPEDGSVEYNAEEIAAAAQNSDFSSLVTELGRIIGTTPSRSYLTVLMDAYDHLGMPTEVIMLLLNHCADECRRRYGEQRRPTAMFISRTAYSWVNREIMTPERAEEHLAAIERRRSDVGRIAGILKIRGRELSPSEEKYINSWLESGWGEDLIAAAYDRTMESIGVLKWPYMNKILQNWNTKGIRSAADVEKADGKSRVPSGSGRISVSAGELDDAWERITGKGK